METPQWFVDWKKPQEDELELSGHCGMIVLPSLRAVTFPEPCHLHQFQQSYCVYIPPSKFQAPRQIPGRGESCNFIQGVNTQLSLIRRRQKAIIAVQKKDNPAVLPPCVIQSTPLGKPMAGKGDRALMMKSA